MKSLVYTKFLKPLLLLSLLLLGFGLLGAPKIATAQWDQDVLEPDSARVVVMDGVSGWIIDVDYVVTAGPSVDAYLCEGALLFLLGPPSEYILFNDDSTEDHWTYTFPSSDSYSLVFINDKSQEITVSYLININPFGNTVLPQLLQIIGFIAGIALLVIVIIVITFTIRKRKSKERLDEGA